MQVKSERDQATGSGVASSPGGGSADLATDSHDPAELRALLERARSRLSFYEGFEQAITENVHRSGELMQEALRIRDEASAASIAQSDTERIRVGELVASLEASVTSIRGQLGRLDSQVATLRSIFEPGLESAAVPLAATDDQPTTEPLVIDGTSHQDVAGIEAAEPVVPHTIQVIAHNVPRAATAIALQRYLGALDIVSFVEAREFAQGVVRLEATASRPLAAADFGAWTYGGSLSIERAETHVIELALAD